MPVMRRFGLAGIAAILVAGFGSAAFANPLPPPPPGASDYELYYQSIDGDTADFELVLGGPSATPGYDVITDIIGTFYNSATNTTSAIDGLSTYASADNLFDPGGTDSGTPQAYFTFGGLSFDVGGLDINIANDLGGGIPYTEDVSNLDPIGYPEFALTSLIVPEPMSIVLLGTGLLGLALCRRRKGA